MKKISKNNSRFVYLWLHLFNLCIQSYQFSFDGKHQKKHYVKYPRTRIFFGPCIFSTESSMMEKWGSVETRILMFYVVKENIDTKWLNPFLLKVLFWSPWKHQKTNDFFMFSGGLKETLGRRGLTKTKN